MLQFKRWTRSIFSLLLLGMFLSRSAHAQDEIPSVQDRKDAWRHQSEEVQTARMTMWHRNGVAKQPADWQAVERAADILLAKANANDSQATLEAMIDCIVSIANPVNPRAGALLTIIAEGDSNVRNIIEIDDEKRIDSGFTNNASVIYRSNFREAHIEPGESIDAKYRLHYVRPTVVPGADWVISESNPASDWQLAWVENGISCRVLVDRRTSVVTRIELGESKLRLRGGIAEFAGGVSIPTWGIDISMGSKGRVRSFDAFVMRDAEFNVPLPDSDLPVTVPEGTRLIDRRNPGVERVAETETAGEVLKLAETIPFRENPPDNAGHLEPPVDAPRTRTWLWVNLAVLALAAIALGVKRMVVTRSSSNQKS